MKIGLVRRGYSPTGGAEAYLLRLLPALAREGHEPHLISDTAWPEEALAGLHPRQTALAAKGPPAFADALREWRRSNTCDFLLSLERVWECDAYRAGDGVHAAWLERRRAHEAFWKAPLRRMYGKHRQLLHIE